MTCRICHEDINEKGQCNISPISGYPVCEDCKDEIGCEKCFDTSRLFYFEDDFTNGKLLCQDCLIKDLEKRGRINVVKTYYTDEWTRICDEGDSEPIIEYLKDSHDFDLQEVVL